MKYPRQLSIPTVRDRLTLRVLADVLLTAFPESRPKLPQTVVQEILRDLRSGQYESFIRIDVQQFYPSLDHDRLGRELATRIRKTQIHQLVRSAITTPTVSDTDQRPRSRSPKGVPQGLSISNLLAEIYMRPVDAAIRALSNMHADLTRSDGPSVPTAVDGPVAYHRYVDDILVLCDNASRSAVKDACRTAINSVGLAVHDDGVAGKSDDGPLTSTFTFLGYEFEQVRLGVKPANVHRLEARLARHYANWRTETVIHNHADYRLAWHLNLTITGCIFDGRAYGWIQYFREINDRTLLKKLDWTVAQLQHRYGAPPTVHPKTFTRAHWAVTHPTARNRRYIPDFGAFDDTGKRDLLANYGIPDVNVMTNAQVHYAFNGIVSKAVRDLEADVGNIS